jgi:hypothetical protein
MKLDWMDELRWFGRAAKLFEGSLSEVPERLVQFELVPIESLQMTKKTSTGSCTVALGSPARLLVVSKARENERPVAVAMVSGWYTLIQHADLIKTLMDTLKRRTDTLTGDSFAAESLHSTLLSSEHGERIYLEVILGHPLIMVNQSDLPYFEMDIRGDMEQLFNNRHPLLLSLHLFNSVDKSMALGMRLGWYVSLSHSGFYLGGERKAIRKVHSRDRRPINLPILFDELVAAIPGQVRLLNKYLAQPVSLDPIAAWVDSVVSQAWGVSAAARVFHIAKYGCDGLVDIMNPRNCKPHARRVHSRIQVPGISSRAQCVLDLLVILGWVASVEPVVEERLAMKDQTQALLDQFLAKKGSSR